MSDLSDSVDWDARADDVLADQISAYDRMRSRCPVARDESGHWSLFTHGDVVSALKDHDAFSNAVSVHVAVPNGMDPPEHTSFRELVDGYYTPERLTDFEPVLRDIAIRTIDGIPRGEPVEVLSMLAEPFAIAVQNAFMGWSQDLAEPLMSWNKKNQAAVLSQDRDQLSAVAMEFDTHIRAQLALRSDGQTDDVTAQLMREKVDGRSLTDDEIVAIIRNWTVGELGTMSASFAIIIEFLARNSAVQDRLRTHPELAVAASDEILRIHPPLIANRRRTTRDVTLHDREIPAESRVNLVWASANRDESVFGDPDEFRLDREPDQNILYGVGIHYCPGAPLARLEFKVLLEELLARVSSITPVSNPAPQLAIFPGAGWSQVHVQFE
ncbi:MAG: cytochrome P450 [Actinomycetales bacterium]|nr:cytochrome P450 [Actinomycetales bacterium]